MSTDATPTERLLKALQLTRDTELDCDAFHALLAPLLDGRIDRADVLHAMAHHRKACPECNEETILLRTALGLLEPDAVGRTSPSD